MAEYISKQKVTDRLGCCLANAKAEYKAAKDEFTKARFGDYISAIQAMIDVVECTKAADVQPVKRGRWVCNEELYYNGMAKCSCCEAEFYVEDLQALQGDAECVKFCPNCGADMIGDENGTKT